MSAVRSVSSVSNVRCQDFPLGENLGVDLGEMVLLLDETETFLS